MGNRSHTPTVTLAQSSDSSQEICWASAGNRMRKAVHGEVCSGVQCPEISLKSCHKFRVVFLAFTYLVLKLNRTTPLYRATANKNITLSYYTEGLRKASRADSPRVRVTLKKTARGLIHREFLSCFETAEAAIIPCSSNARAALSAVLLHTALNRPLPSPWGLCQHAHHTWAWGICLQSNSALLSLHNAPAYSQPYRRWISLRSSQLQREITVKQAPTLLHSHLCALRHSIETKNHHCSLQLKIVEWICTKEKHRKTAPQGLKAHKVSQWLDNEG